MKRSLIVVAALSLAIGAAQANDDGTKFDRFTAELTPMLERDALTVMTRAINLELAAYVCTRQPGEATSWTETALANWKTRNQKYTKASAAAIRAIADRIEAAQGSQAKQSYLGQVQTTSGQEAEKRVANQFSGPSPSNALIPSAEACTTMAAYTNMGAGDFENNPQITVALREFMKKQQGESAP